MRNLNIIEFCLSFKNKELIHLKNQWVGGNSNDF